MAFSWSVMKWRKTNEIVIDYGRAALKLLWSTSILKGLIRLSLNEDCEISNTLLTEIREIYNRNAKTINFMNKTILFPYVEYFKKDIPLGFLF